MLAIENKNEFEDAFEHHRTTRRFAGQTSREDSPAGLARADAVKRIVSATTAAAVPLYRIERDAHPQNHRHAFYDWRTRANECCSNARPSMDQLGHSRPRNNFSPGCSRRSEFEEELKHQPADIIFLFDDDESNLEKPSAVRSAGSLLHLEHQFGGAIDDAKVIGVCFGKRSTAQLEEALNSEPAIRNRLLKVIQFARMHSTEVRGLLSVLTEQLPNQAKVEMIRISRDREAQHHVAQMLIKSTTAICTAIGAQPIPLADLPVLTALQVMMVSGIMYISGRERSLRAATEFMTAVGANVGAGMLLREGARAILKFFPGWGNVVCGMVAGAGTYAIGRSASAFFIGGVSLKDARQKYLAARKKASHKAHLLEDSRRASKSIE